MRPVHLTDLDIATRVLLALDEHARADRAHRIVAAARMADRYRKRLRRRHPDWGDGTLAAAALSHGAPALQKRCDPAYRMTLRLLLDAMDAACVF